MKLSLNWLNDYIDTSAYSASALADKLTLSTCEVEGYECTFEHLDDILIAKIIDVQPHPHADRLSICRVQAHVLPETVLEIVCGAPNVAQGMHVALAPVGARLPILQVSPEGQGNPEKFWTIQETTIRKIASYGMLCSAEELGLGELFAFLTEEDGGNASKGILDLVRFFSELPNLKTKANQPLKGLQESLHADSLGAALAHLSLKDCIFDIDNKSITHRPDLWSHFGFARELAAVLRRPLLSNPLELSIAERESIQTLENPNIENPKLYVEKSAALAYSCTRIENIEPYPSPFWMRLRLYHIGEKSINNIVDASNYIMFDLGQPNHCFDWDSLGLPESREKADADNKGVHVHCYQRTSVLPPVFTALDGVDRTLQADSLLITSGDLSSARTSLTSSPSFRRNDWRLRFECASFYEATPFRVCLLLSREGA